MEIKNCNNCIWRDTCNMCEDNYRCEDYLPVDEMDISEEEYINDLHTRIDDYNDMIAEYSDHPAEI